MQITADHIKRAAGLRPFENRVHLTGRGNHRTATCPFHDDSNPSLHIDLKNGVWLWRCFPCESRNGAKNAGDGITFVQQFDRVDFATAMETIKRECGVEEAIIDKARAESPTSDRPPKKLQYEQEAATARLEEAESYLEARGISLDLARGRGLGVFDFPGLGPTLAMPYGDTGAVKFRALNKKEFRQAPGHPSNDLLFGPEVLDDPDDPLDVFVIVTESELDSLTLCQAGFLAVSVSTSNCVEPDGGLRIKPEYLDKLDRADLIYLALDQDSPGTKCAAAFEKYFGTKCKRMHWAYDPADATTAKDIGEIFKLDPAKFAERIKTLQREATDCLAAVDRQPAWRAIFKSLDQMECGGMRFLVKDFIPEGVVLLGGLSGAGKTWVCLDIARALTQGERLFGHFEVPERVNVIYLIPESSESSFRKRMEKMRINERFLCRTLRDGVLELQDDLLLQAVQELKPVIFLDTLIRFSRAENENSASENAAGLADGIFALLRAGARAVIGIHHAPKKSGDREPNLENTLRGSGDIGAMADAVWRVSAGENTRLELELACVKARDFEQPAPFKIQGKPHLDEKGQFVMLDRSWNTDEAAWDKISAVIKSDAVATLEKISRHTGLHRDRVSDIAREHGWKKTRKQWEMVDGETTSSATPSVEPALAFG